MVSRLRDEIGKRGPFDSLAQEFFLNLQRTADVLGREFDGLFKSSGISGQQYNVLRILRGAGNEGLPCGVIGDRMISRDPDMTRLLDRLEKHGWIQRARQTDDRRVVLAKITRKGLNLLAELDEPIRKLHEQQLDHMNERQLKTLIDLLEQTRLKPQRNDHD